jgi:hypothetical protein
MSPVARQGALSRAAIFIGLAVTVIAVLLGLVGPQLSTANAATQVASRPVAAAAASAAPLTVQQMTQQVIDETNAIRYEQGLPGLVRDARLDQVAAAWAKQQFMNGAMSHNPNYSTQIPSGWQRAGENVAKGYTYTQVTTAWKNSASHYANLVNDYTSVGVGYYEQDGHRYWSQVFAKYPGTVQPTGPAAAPKPTTPAPAPTTTPKPTTPAPTPTTTPKPTTPAPTPSTPAPAPTTPTAPAPSTASPAAEPAAPAGTRIALSSPSFESGLGGWSAPSGTVDGPNSSARGGVKSLLVPGASNRVVTQSVTTAVNAGSSHTVVVWIRADAKATGAVRLRALGGTSAEVATMEFTASNTGWLAVSVTLKTKVAHTGFTIEIVTSTSGRSYRLDSVSLTRTVDGTVPAAAPAPAPSPTPTTPAPVPTTTPKPATPAPAPTTTPKPATPAPAPTTPAPAPTTPAPAPAPVPTPTPTPSTPAPAPSSKPVITLGGIRLGG